MKRDNDESLIKRNIINQLMIETESNEKRIFRKPQPVATVRDVKIAERSDSEIEEDTSPGGRRMKDRPVKKADESPVNPKFKLGRSISSANISSKNGYLFLKRVHG